MFVGALTGRRVGVLRGALLAALLTVSAGLVFAPVARAEDGTTTFSADPAGDAGPDGRGRFSYELAPGQRVDDKVAVRNQSDQAHTFVVYATDAYNTNEGAFALLTSDEAPAGAGTWADFGSRCDPAADAGCTVPSSATVALDPGAMAVVPFTVTVPDDARPGDHAAGVIASLAAGQGQVAVESRVITRMYVRVAGDLQPAISVAGIRSAVSGGVLDWNRSVEVTYTLDNTGNVALRGRVSVWVTGPFGRTLAEAPTQETAELLPGEDLTLTILLEDVPSLGLLTAHVRLDPFVDPGGLDPGPLAVTERGASIWLVPWPGLVLVLLLAAGAVVLVVRRRRMAARHEAEVTAALEAGRRLALTAGREDER